MRIMEKHSSVTAYLTSAWTAMFGSLTLNDVALYVGILTGIGTFLVNWYYKDREDRRQERGRYAPTKN